MLLATLKKKWDFKGQLELLTIEGDFFLFKFLCVEAFDLVLNVDPCFLNGNPFIFKKWSSNVKLIKENFTKISPWIKMSSFPLSCWNEKGFSKIANKFCTPLIVDNVTAKKMQITFARVCVPNSPSSPYLMKSLSTLMAIFGSKTLAMIESPKPIYIVILYLMTLLLISCLTHKSNSLLEGIAVVKNLGPNKLHKTILLTPTLGIHQTPHPWYHSCFYHPSK